MEDVHEWYVCVYNNLVEDGRGLFAGAKGNPRCLVVTRRVPARCFCQITHSVS